MQLIHGGDIYSFAESHEGTLLLDLSANINPFGIPETVRQAMHNAVENCTCYPDPLCRALRRTIGNAENVPPDFLFCGNGAAEVLFRLSTALKPRTALLTAPTFAEYEQSLQSCKIMLHTLLEEEDFVVTPRILQDITEQLDIVYLCNPNNPTGRTIEPKLLRQIVHQCAECGAYLVVDECFNDFLTEADTNTLKGLLVEYPKLILLRAFTKMYAVPGVRLGYCMCADSKVIEMLYHAGQPWNVSVIAQACGIAATGLCEFAQKTARMIEQERAFMLHELEARRLKVFTGQANFLLWKTADTKLHNKLLQKGILIRNCANYHGLAPGFYRTAVKSRSENLRFLRALDHYQSLQAVDDGLVE